MPEILIPAPSGIATFVELLRWRAGEQPDTTALSFMPDGTQETDRLTYSQIDCRARAIAANLRELRAEGKRVLLVYPPGLEFVSAFFGCLYARAVAVPIYPPPPNRAAPRLEAAVESARPAVALTTAKVKADIDRRSETAPYLHGYAGSYRLSFPPMRPMPGATRVSDRTTWRSSNTRPARRPLRGE
ncbi:MAG: AMP-binding protein [Gemmataceae bacterium]